MLCMYAMYMGTVFLFKASSKGIFAELHSKIPFRPHRQRAQTKLREKKRHSDRRLDEALALTLI